MDTAAPTVNGENLHTAVVRISTANFAAARAAGLAVGAGRAPRGGVNTKAHKLFSLGNAHRLAIFLGYLGDVPVHQLASIGWTYETVQASLHADARLTPLSARLPSPGWHRLGGIRAGAGE